MAKGSNFERDICRKLSRWWTGGKRPDVFWRTAGSGARATVRMKKNECTALSAGDIGCIDPVGAKLIQSCLIEIKRGYSDRGKIVKSKKTGKQSVQITKGINILSCLDKLKSQKPPVLIEWWEKAEKERVEHKRKYSFIIFKRDRKEESIMFSENTYHILKKKNMNLKLNLPMIYLRYEFHELMIVKLDDFLAWCNPSSFRQRRMIKRRKI